MKEIKFRAWKEVIHLSKPNEYKIVYDIQKDLHFEDIILAHNSNSSDIVLMQFTGLLDKNGKEIYEGDIVEMRNPERYTDEELYKVMIEKQWVGDSSLPAETYGYLFPKNKDGLKVIGNIYDNPELLKEQN